MSLKDKPTSWNLNTFSDINIVKHPYAKFQDSQHQNVQSKTLIASQSTAGAKWSFDSQKVQIFGQHLILKPQTSVDQCLIMILKAWLKKSQDAKVSIFGQLKKSTVTWPRHNFHMVYQKNSIQSSFWREWHFLQLLFTLQVQEMLSQKVINFNIIGHFQKSTKRDFRSKAITWYW